MFPSTADGLTHQEEEEEEHCTVSFWLSRYMSEWRRDPRFVLVLSKPIKRCCATSQPMSCLADHVTAVNFRSEASALPLFCVSGLQDVLSSQTSHFTPISELNVGYNTCAPRRAYVTGRGSRATAFRARGRTGLHFWGVSLNQPAGHVHIITQDIRSHIFRIC